jgi:peptidoglycan L-alanyl-D-glutamate endopeptidase CwlK
MAIVLGTKSLKNLEGVHPDLVRVVKRAAAMATKDGDFTVLEGVRTKERMWETYGQGRTASECAAKGVPTKYAKPGMAKVTWLNNPLMSNHRVMPDGFGHAVDLAPWPIDWNNLKRFDQLALLMFRAAALEGIKIRWGADWDQDGKPREKGETDSPHFELAS